MMRSRPMFLTALLLSAAASHGVDDALQPLRDGVPEVAVVRLKERLKGPLDPAEAQTAKIALAEALLAADKPEEALTLVQELDAPLIRARIEAALGRWEEALASYDSVHSTDSAVMTEQVLGKVECLRRLGRFKEAIALLEASKIDSARLILAELCLENGDFKRGEAVLKAIGPVSGLEQKRRLYLEARLFLAQNQPAFAYERFEALMREPHALPPTLLIGSLLGMSDALVQLNGATAADNVVEKFLWEHPDVPQIDLVFRKLDEIYASEKDSSDSELQKLSQREPTLRAGYATYYLAKMAARAQKPDRALRSLNQISEKFPKHPILADALLLQGELLAKTGAFEAAQKSFEAAMRASGSDLQRAEIEMASATAYFKAREFVLAATLFRAVGERAPSLWQRAVFNSALSWLHQGNYTRFLEDYKELSRRYPESPYRRELILEEGLLQARQGAFQEAEKTLKQFLRDFPENRRVAEAQLALAEIRFGAGDANGAANYLRVANTNTESPQTSEKSAYLAIFVADAATPRDDEKVTTLCREFLSTYPDSVHKAEVRMKLGQIFFRQANFVGAQAEFETLAREEPESPLAAPALFLAGQASLKSMSQGGIDHAIALFEEVAKRDSALKGYARLQQAMAQNQLGKQNEAILLYDAILAANPSVDLKHAAIAGKAENLAELGTKDRAACEQALALFEQLAADPETTPVWRGQALYKKGRCLEELKRLDEALAAYYDVLQAGVSQPEEYFWFYKAGFDAGRLSEGRAEWKSAVGIYRKIAAQDGPRAEEAKARAEELRLKHFIWE